MNWRDHAACKGQSVHLFYPEDGCIAGAMRICAVCPVREQCSADGRTEEYGIWGGLTPNARLRTPRRTYVGGPQRRPINHGTVAGYKTHRKRGEVACDDCKRANVDYVMEQKRRRRRSLLTACGKATSGSDDGGMVA